MSRVKLAGPGNRVLSTLKFMRDPYTCYARWKEKYGPTFLVKALNGNVVVTGNTENIRRVFAAPFDSLGQFAVETIKPLMGGSSVILVEGEQHRRERALLSPSFHGERIAGKAEEIHDVALRVGSHWQQGETIRMMDTSLDVSLEVIIRVVFGVQSQDRVELYKERIKQFVSSFHPLLAFSRLLQRPLFGFSPWNQFLSARSELYELLDEEISSRSQANSTDNLLSRLIDAKYDDGGAVQRSSIRDQLVTMLLAGHETTQIAMTWAMSWLHRNPILLERLRDELSDLSLDEILKNQLLDGVCNESLRLNSVVSDTVRTLRKPMQFEELELPAETNVAIAICLVHEDPEIFPEPKKFDPDRWQHRRCKPYEFMPFGGGIRRCIGATLAMLEMKVVIATWVQNFRFSLPTDIPEVEPTYRRNITMAPKSGIPLVFEGRM